MTLPLRDGLKDGGKDREGVLMKKLLLLGMVAILLSFALVMVSCGAKCPGDGNCDTTGGLGADWKYCGNNITDKKDLEKAMECDVYKKAVQSQTGKCDC
jgi:hypothetical protein